jgi:hypothetical protein
MGGKMGKIEGKATDWVSLEKFQSEKYFLISSFFCKLSK